MMPVARLAQGRAFGTDWILMLRMTMTAVSDGFVSLLRTLTMANVVCRHKETQRAR